MGCTSSAQRPPHAAAGATAALRRAPRQTGPLPAVPASAPHDRITAVVVHWNPQRYRRRAQLFNACVERLAETKYRLARRGGPFGLNVIAVELVYGDLASELALDRVRHLVTVIERRVPERQVMWSKEQLVNLALRSLPADEEFAAWIDGDITFASDAWVEAAVRTLRASPTAFGQLWETCDMLGPKGQKLSAVTSFARQHAWGKTFRPRGNKDPEYWHPGFAWCATLRALRATDYLIDKTLGSADLHMAMALVGLVAQTVPDGVSAQYRSNIEQWQDRARAANLQMVLVPGRITHSWHGKLQNRQYMERWRVVVENNFDPSVDLVMDENLGLYLWSETVAQEMIDATSDYFLKRQEDSDELDAGEGQGGGGSPAGSANSQSLGDDGRLAAWDPAVDPLAATDFWSGYA